MATRTQLKLAAAAAAAALLAAACGANAATEPEPPVAQPPAPVPPPAEMPEPVAPSATPPEPIADPEPPVAELETTTAALDISPPEGGGTPPPAPVATPAEMTESIAPAPTESIAETEPTAPESETAADLDDGAAGPPPHGGRPPGSLPQPELQPEPEPMPDPQEITEDATSIFIQSFGDDGFPASEPSTILFIGFATRPSGSSSGIATIDIDIDTDIEEVHGDHSPASAVAHALVLIGLGHQIHRVVAYEASSQYLNHFGADSAPGAYVVRAFGDFPVDDHYVFPNLAFTGSFRPSPNPSTPEILPQTVPQIRYACIQFCEDPNPPPPPPYPDTANECEKSLFSEFTRGGRYSKVLLIIDYNYNKPRVKSEAEFWLPPSEFPAVEAVIAADLASLEGNFDIRNVRVLGGSAAQSEFTVQADGDFEPFDVSRALCQLDDIEYAYPGRTTSPR